MRQTATDELNPYTNGKIYCIRSKNSPKVYVGSTTYNLEHRLKAHTYAKTTTSREIIEAGDAFITLLESYPCENKKQLQLRESEFMRFMRHVVNKRDDSKSFMCDHNKQRAQCKQCRGAQICEHNRHRQQCKDCSNIVCECCKLSTSTGNWKQHLKSMKHLRNFIHW